MSQPDEKPRVKAQWSFDLYIECPKCGADFDHSSEADDWHMGWSEPPEVGKSGQTFSTACPSCDHEFDCETQY